MYRAIMRFKDLRDDGYIYSKGEIYPRKGLEVSDERIEELASDANKSGFPLIREVKARKKKVQK